MTDGYVFLTAQDKTVLASLAAPFDSGLVEKLASAGRQLTDMEYQSPEVTPTTVEVIAAALVDDALRGY